MKIAFFVNSFPTISETFIVNQIVGLLDTGHEVTIYAQTKAEATLLHPIINEYNLLDKTIFLEDVPTGRLSKIAILIKGFLKRPFFVGKWIWQFRNNRKTSGLSVYSILPFLQSSQFDIVHAHFGPTGNYLLKLRNAGLFKEAKFVTTFHGYDMMVEPAFYKNLFASDVMVTVNSEYSKSQLLRIGCPVEKINILPVGLATTYFKRINFQHQTFTLLFVGRLVAFKGPVIFINICKELADRNKIDFKAVMIGDGELKQKLEEQIKLLELNSIVKMSGSKTQEEIKYFMENADVFVLPGITDNGRAETQGLVIQEAQAMNLPVLVSDAGGMKEGLHDGVTGFVIKEGDIMSFADKIILLAQDQNLKEKMGNEGQRFVEKKYETALLTGKLMELYNNFEA